MIDSKTAREITRHEERVRDMADAGAPLEQTLGALVEIIEDLSRTNVLGSILLLDKAGKHLTHGAAPSLPPAYCEAIEGVEIGPSVGSCGTAAYCGYIVMVGDIANDPLWIDYRDLALEHGLRACWSLPIRSSSGAILGTFALYHRETRSPSIIDRQIVDRLSKTAAEVIELARQRRKREAKG